MAFSRIRSGRSASGASASAVPSSGSAGATGTDGKQVFHRGGCVARVRPDGTEFEIFADGTRNIYDVAVDPYLNAFTRDNTNDGGRWNVRLNHITSTAHFGYPSLYMNFKNEIMKPLADFGGGSGTGTPRCAHASTRLFLRNRLASWPQ